MTNPPQLNIDIELNEIFEAVQNEEDIEFIATPEQLNIENTSEFMGKQTFHASPINPPKEVLNILTTTAKENINSLILYSFLKEAQMLYSIWKNDDLILVEIKF